MKMQGVVGPGVSIDIAKHFERFDARAEQRAKEQAEYEEFLKREAKTTVGAVKRLI